LGVASGSRDGLSLGWLFMVTETVIDTSVQNCVNY